MQNPTLPAKEKHHQLLIQNIATFKHNLITCGHNMKPYLKYSSFKKCCYNIKPQQKVCKQTVILAKKGSERKGQSILKKNKKERKEKKKKTAPEATIYNSALTSECQWQGLGWDL